MTQVIRPDAPRDARPAQGVVPAVGNAPDGAPFIGNDIGAPGLPVLFMPPPEQVKHVVPDRHVAGFLPRPLVRVRLLITPVSTSTSDQRSRKSSLGPMRAPVAMPSTMTRWICGAAASYSRRASLADGGAMRWALGLAMRSDTSGLESSRRARTAQPYAARECSRGGARWTAPTPRWRCTSHQASTSSQVTQCARRWPKMAVSGSTCCVVVLLVVGFSSVPAYRSRSSATVAFVAEAEDMRRLARRISSRSRICISACTDSNAAPRLQSKSS